VNTDALDDDVFLRPEDPPSNRRLGPFSRNTLSKHVAQPNNPQVNLKLTSQQAIFHAGHHLPQEATSPSLVLTDSITNIRRTATAIDGCRREEEDEALATELDTEAEENAVRQPLLPKKPGQPGNTVPRPVTAVGNRRDQLALVNNFGNTYTRRKLTSVVHCHQCGHRHDCQVVMADWTLPKGSLQRNGLRRSVGATPFNDENTSIDCARRRSFPHVAPYVNVDTTFTEAVTDLAGGRITTASAAKTSPPQAPSESAPPEAAMAMPMRGRPARLHFFDGDALVNSPGRESLKRLGFMRDLSSDDRSTAMVAGSSVSGGDSAGFTSDKRSMYWDNYEMRNAMADSDV